MRVASAKRVRAREEDPNAGLPHFVQCKGGGEPHEIGACPLKFDGDEMDLDPDAERRLRVMNVHDFLALELPPRENLLAPWLPRQGLVMIHAWRGLGKTLFALDCAYALACGSSFLRFEAANPCRVLYVDGELSAAMLQERVAAIVKAGKVNGAHLDDPDRLRLITPDLQDGVMPDLATLTGQLQIERELDGVDVVFFDNVSTLFRHHEGDANSEESWRIAQSWLLELRRRGHSVVLIHHSGKGLAQRGSSKKEDILDTVISLRKPGDYREEQGARFEVVFEKNRGFYGEDAKPFEAALGTDAHGRPEWTMKRLDDQVTERVAAMLRDGTSHRDIASELKIGLATVNRHKVKATKLGLVHAADE